MRAWWIFSVAIAIAIARVGLAADSSDTAVLAAFLKGVSNGQLLNWDIEGGSDPCGWAHIECQGNFVTKIGVEGMKLEGILTPEINKLANLEYLGIQSNKFSGPLPTLAGLKNLQVLYMNDNSFTSIPSDFFKGLAGLQTVYLDNNNLNSTSGGWSIPDDLQFSTNLVNLSLTNTNLRGEIPPFLGTIGSLKVLNLAYNGLTGEIPSTFANSGLLQLELNNIGSMSGPIEVLGSMTGLTQVWLQGNKFSGEIPTGLSDAINLRDLRLNNNALVGTIPQNLTQLRGLQIFEVDNNQLMGSIPAIKAANFTYSSNQFCQAVPGKDCDPQVDILIDFIGAAGYPSVVISAWTGNDPCSFRGVNCDKGVVVSITLRDSRLVGTISPAIGGLPSLNTLILSNNFLSGPLPPVLGKMASLVKLDLSNNNLTGPMIKFQQKMELRNLSGNPLLEENRPAGAPPSFPPVSSPPTNSGGIPPTVKPGGAGDASDAGDASVPAVVPGRRKPTSLSVGAVAVPVAVGIFLALLIGGLVYVFCCRKKSDKKQQSLLGGQPRSPMNTSMSVHPRNSTSDPDMVKVAAGSGNGSLGTGNGSGNSDRDIHIIEAGNLVISIQVLRQATNNFSQDTILGEGGFGVVYKGVLHDGTNIAVKRMESSRVVSSKGLSEFQAEIAVLTKVRHRHLVALLGYCIDGNEKLLVYEFLPNGTLSQHLFENESLQWEPLSWKKRLVIALDVARGLEYLHTLAHRSFIHRDLKPSNILLDDDFRAKVSDFGLVKLAPEGKFSVETKLAGTFGYLAPEYAVTGRITTKADVFSFGVVLMELITGRRALDETQTEENMHLVSWFRRTAQNRESVAQIVDANLEDKDEKLDSICTVTELARHCTARDPYQRPDMGHAVNVLAPLVKQWRPTDLDGEELVKGIDLNMTLPQALKQWQASDDSMSLEDSQASLPTRPVGFADSFGSSDAR